MEACGGACMVPLAVETAILSSRRLCDPHPRIVRTVPNFCRHDTRRCYSVGFDDRPLFARADGKMAAKSPRERFDLFQWTARNSGSPDYRLAGQFDDFVPARSEANGQ